MSRTCRLPVPPANCDNVNPRHTGAQLQAAFAIVLSKLCLPQQISSSIPAAGQWPCNCRQTPAVQGPNARRRLLPGHAIEHFCRQPSLQAGNHHRRGGCNGWAGAAWYAAPRRSAARLGPGRAWPLAHPADQCPRTAIAGRKGIRQPEPSTVSLRSCLSVAKPTAPKPMMSAASARHRPGFHRRLTRCRAGVAYS